MLSSSALINWDPTFHGVVHQRDDPDFSKPSETTSSEAWHNDTNASAAAAMQVMIHHPRSGGNLLKDLTIVAKLRTWLVRFCYRDRLEPLMYSYIRIHLTFLKVRWFFPLKRGPEGPRSRHLWEARTLLSLSWRMSMHPKTMFSVRSTCCNLWFDLHFSSDDSNIQPTLDRWTSFGWLGFIKPAKNPKRFNQIKFGFFSKNKRVSVKKEW